MTIIYYDADDPLEGVKRDTRVDSPNVYMGNGQGCGTVWYDTTHQARAACKRNGGVVPHGNQSGLCDQCRCRYRHGTRKHREFPEFACRGWKEQWRQEV